MKSTQKRARTTTGRRRTSRKKLSSIGITAKFLRQTFCYLKGEQFLKASNQLICEAF